MGIRIFITLLMVAAGIGVMYMLAEPYGGLLAVTVGLLIFAMALSIWTLPSRSFERGHRLDPSQRRIIGGFFGTGLGLIGGLLITALIPRPYNLLVLAAVAVGVLIWWFRRS